MFAQQLCEEKVGWDETLTGDLLKQWRHLSEILRDAKVITIPRLLYFDATCSARLTGLCDASARAYTAIVYLREEHHVDVNFVAAKTRAAPVGGMTTPRLELLA